MLLLIKYYQAPCGSQRGFTPLDKRLSHRFFFFLNNSFSSFGFSWDGQGTLSLSCFEGACFGICKAHHFYPSWWNASDFLIPPGLQAKVQPLHSFCSVPHFLEQASNFSILCHRSRVRISQIIKSWFFFCVTVLSSISFFSHFTLSRWKKSGLIFNMWLQNLLSSISKSTMYKFCYYLSAGNHFPKLPAAEHGSLFPWFPVARSSFPSEPSWAAVLSVHTSANGLF